MNVQPKEMKASPDPTTLMGKVATPPKFDKTWRTSACIASRGWRLGSGCSRNLASTKGWQDISPRAIRSSWIRSGSIRSASISVRSTSRT